jgi:hypothetical protein
MRRFKTRQEFGNDPPNWNEHMDVLFGLPNTITGQIVPYPDLSPHSWNITEVRCEGIGNSEEGVILTLWNQGALTREIDAVS